MGTATPRDIARFWTKVEMPTGAGCWVWKARIDSNGYGRCYIFGRTFKAHRISWLLFHGEAPTGLVLHHCDNPPCVNPDHLYVGTHFDNTRDCIARGRFKPGRLRGSLIGVAKLTDDQVREIRALRRSGLSLEKIAERYPVGPTSIGNVVSGRCWSHVTEAVS